MTDEYIGKKYGRLTVLELSHKDKHSNKHYKCQCDCGITKTINIQSLKLGKTTSCGCYNREITSGAHPDRRKNNEFRVHPNFVRVKASNCDKYFLVDLEDWEYLKEYTFYVSVRGYIETNIKNGTGKIGRMILKPSDGFVIDHINGDILDNRKINLRICSQSDNMKNLKTPITNTSGYKGVWFDKINNKWAAEIKCDGIKYFLGRFVNIIDAAKARADAEIKYFGEYRRKEGVGII